MANNLLSFGFLPCGYGVHTVVAEDIRTSHTGAPVCKGCLEDYDTHDGFSSCSCGFRDHTIHQLDEWCLALQESGGRDCMHTPPCEEHTHTELCVFD